MIKALKRELLIYLAIWVALCLYMHPERIKIIESPFQIAHSFAWSFGVYVIILLLRQLVKFVTRIFKKKQ